MAGTVTATLPGTVTATLPGTLPETLPGTLPETMTETSLQPFPAELHAVPAWMASEVRALLPHVDREGYQRFLDHMVHYTRGSGERLRIAATEATVTTHRAFFAELAREEAHHFRLAEADLAAFGRAPSSAPPHAVVEFDRRWRGWDASARIGALFALESVGSHLASDARMHLGRLGLGRDQARFILVHLQADVAHGAATAALLDQGAVAGAAQLRVREAIHAAATFWVDLHRGAFQPG